MKISRAPDARGVALGMLVAAALALPGVSAFAQQTPVSAAAPAEEVPLTEVIVTGTRIAAPNEVSTSPIEVLSSKYIETSGKTDASDLIMQLPQNLNNSIGQDLGNTSSGLTTAGGIATADLRGLGPNRTLVLVDGRRLGQGSPYTFIQSPAPDLDQIPAGLVDRIEVVTGGASAAYGSDAIAGVINFIMKKNFQGFQVDGQSTSTTIITATSTCRAWCETSTTLHQQPARARMAGSAPSMCSWARTSRTTRATSPHT